MAYLKILTSHNSYPFNILKIIFAKITVDENLWRATIKDTA
jgi:hypothetical protein